MKKRIFITIIGVVLLLSGCSTASNVTTTQGYANTLEEAHPDRMEKTVIGMDIKNFKEVWPEATRTVISQDGETYEFVYAKIQEKAIYGIVAYYYKIYTNFYFSDDKLVRYESTQRMM